MWKRTYFFSHHHKSPPLVSSSKEINEVFKWFWEHLYMSMWIHFFFKHKIALDAPITEDEIMWAIAAMKTGKFPGVDGFPIENNTLDILASILTKVFLEAFNLESLLSTFNEALISLIPKKDRDAMDPSNYWKYYRNYKNVICTVKYWLKY